MSTESEFEKLTDQLVAASDEEKRIKFAEKIRELGVHVPLQPGEADAKPQTPPSREKYVTAAKKLYGKQGEVEINRQAEVKPDQGWNGKWVNAWVYVCTRDARNG